MILRVILESVCVTVCLFALACGPDYYYYRGIIIIIIIIKSPLHAYAVGVATQGKKCTVCALRVPVRPSHISARDLKAADTRRSQAQPDLQC